MKKPFKQTGLVLGFYLAISVASLATSGLAWFITTRQATVSFSKISVIDKNGRLYIEMDEPVSDVETTAVVPEQLSYAISAPVTGDTGGARKVRYVDVYGPASSGLAPIVHRAPDEVILRVEEFDGTGLQDYYFIGFDSNSDGNEDGVTFNKALPVNATSIELHYTFDVIGAYDSTKQMNINYSHPDYHPVETEDSLTITAEPIGDVSSDGETFYRNNQSPDGSIIASVANMTGREKIYGAASPGCYVQFTFWVINELENSAPVDIAISRAKEGEPLLKAEGGGVDADRHYRMAIYDTTDPENPFQVFFYEQKDWEESDHYVSSSVLNAGANTITPILDDDIVDGSELQIVKSSAESGLVPQPGNQLLYSRLPGGEKISLTVRLWCEGTLCNDEDIGQICNANFNLVGFDHY